jgi:ABC-type transport system substrate-binding protein
LNKRSKKLLLLRSYGMVYQRALLHCTRQSTVSGLFSIKKHLFSLPIATLLAAAAPCGTAIIPNGIGLGDPVPPTGLNPLLASGDQNKLQYAILLYRPLVWVGKNIEFDPERSLAASIESMDGNTRFRVTLKPWRWSDGTLITPDDVKFGWERILLLNQPGHAYYSAAGQGGIPDRVRGVLPDGANAVVITLKAAANPDWFILNGLSLIYPLPRHAWGDISADDMKLRELDASLYKVTDGPFRLVDLQPRRQVIYASNPLYGGHPAALQKLLVVSPDTGAACGRSGRERYGARSVCVMAAASGPRRLPLLQVSGAVRVCGFDVQSEQRCGAFSARSGGAGRARAGRRPAGDDQAGLQRHG